MDDIIVVVVAASGRFRGGRCRCDGWTIGMDHRDVVPDVEAANDDNIVPEFTLLLVVFVL